MAKLNKFITIGDITVNLKDVKNAVVHGNRDIAKLLVKTYNSGTLVGYYKATENFGLDPRYEVSCADDKAKMDQKLLTDMLNGAPGICNCGVRIANVKVNTLYLCYLCFARFKEHSTISADEKDIEYLKIV